ncbi:OmpA family protein [Aureisphaera galaxeae]|uniref:OmpA family protein n=1 Tax=Aureisphaera galaxeae TaxID=1538023 RepID=UPI002350F033|nr:OmpA family protein [Aureisphaera galaxeae]MDC8005677.1 OmpA family protein [Aureisphaera galaxeae]
MKSSLKTPLVLVLLLFVASAIQAQTKRIKRPKSSVGIYSVDTFVRNSFDIYDKVYRYDGYAKAGKSLDDDDIDILEDALTDAELLMTSAPNILSDLDGAGALKQAKATLQINKAKKALKYSIKTATELLAGRRSGNEDSEDTSEGDTKDDDSNSEEASSESGTGTSSPGGSSDGPSSTFKINSKFDFVPGDELLFFDDYSNDFIGDFPSKWNTNGSGEVVTFNDNNERWLEILSGYGIYYMPLDVDLPEEYTIEFDLFGYGLDSKTSSTAKLQILLSDNTKFKQGEYWAAAWIPFGQYGAFGIQVKSYAYGEGHTINNTITADIRKATLNRPHISIAVNKERFRLWVNEKKYIDIPKMLTQKDQIKALKFHAEGFKDGKEKIFIRNVKIAKGGLDLRRTLLSEGKVSTNGILFDSGSATIQPQSYGILRQISQVLQQDSSMKLLIVGHTDSDGSDSNNLALSKSRAASVKQALITTYGVDGSRLSTDGKGEGEPVADNSSVDGKAKNRRVVFIRK